MKLYLVRHAIAHERNSTLWPDDSDRPLTKRGARRFKKAARGLNCLVSEVDAVLSSPFQRAWHTANILEKAGWPAPMVCEELARDEPTALIQALEPYADAESLALVGHESHLSHFAAALLGWPRTPWTELKKGGVLCLNQKGLVLGAGAEITWLLPPKGASRPQPD